MTTQTHDAVSHPIGPDGLLVLRVHDGQVNVRGVAGDIATIRSTDGASVDSLEIEPGERSLSIRTRRADFGDFFDFGRKAGGRRGRAKDLQLEVPAGATIVVEGASADLDVRGLHGDQRYRSASGDLVLRDVSGSLTIEAVSGDIEIGADGPATIAARTVSGDMVVRAGSITGLRATTTSGDLRISGRFDGDGPFAIETVSGDATLAPGNDVRVEARTIAGDIESELPSRRDETQGRRALVIGAGGPTIAFRSTSGDLRVVAASPSTPPTPPAPPTPAAPPAPPALAAAPDAPAAPRTATEDDDPRLAILRDLERGDIDVTEAGLRLEALDIEAIAADVDAEEQDHA